jgi:hypothetical protein
MKQNCIFSLEELPCLADHKLEGTPFVPMAVIIEQLARTFGDDCRSFAGIEIITPVMLRKNRAKTLVCTSDEQRACLQDEKGNIYAILEKEADLVSNSRFDLPSPRTAIPSALLKHQIYPSLLFHGPTFQADFVFYEFSRQNLIVELSDFTCENQSLGRYNHKQSIPIVLFDLLLQTAGLHQLAFSDKYGLPTFCKQLLVNENQPDCNRVFVKTSFFREDQTYNISANAKNGRPLLSCAGLRFTPSNREIDTNTKILLENLVK